MEHAVVKSDEPVALAARTGEQGFIGGVLGAALVILLDALVRCVVTGLETGNYRLDFASAVSVFVLVVGAVAITLVLAHVSHRRAVLEYEDTQVQIDRAEHLLTALERELKRG